MEQLVPEAEEEGRKAGQLEEDLQASMEQTETLKKEKEDLEQNVRGERE